MTHEELAEFRADLEARFAEVTDLLVSKRLAYGPHNLIRFGGVGIAIRASDKIERLATMYASDTTEGADGDSMADAWRDLIGYGALGLLFHEQALTPEQKHAARRAVSALFVPAPHPWPPAQLGHCGDLPTADRAIHGGDLP